MKSGFIIYNDWKDLLDDLSLEDRGRVFTALFDVADGEDPDKIENPAARMLLKVMSKQMQKDAEGYLTLHMEVDGGEPFDLYELELYDQSIFAHSLTETAYIWLLCDSEE